MPKQVARLDVKKLDKIIAQHPATAARIVKSTAFAIEGEAKVRAPVDTGALKNSLHSNQTGLLTWRVTDGVEYGIYQELGFHHHRSGAFIQNPFMVPAVEHVRPTWNKMWRELYR